MPKYSAFLGLFWVLPVALLAIDVNESGVSDVFETLHGRILTADGDADKDGLDNRTEYLLGTDPLDPTDPGLLIGVTTGGAGARIRIPSQSGLRYRLAFSENLLVWDEPAFVTADGVTGFFNIDLPENGGGYFRLEATDPLDSNFDNINDWEDGSIPLLGDRDRDLDGRPDADEFSDGSHPLLADTDGDFADDFVEWEAGTDPSDPLRRPWAVRSQSVSFLNLDADPATLAVSISSVYSAPVSFLNLAADPATLATSVSSVYSAPVTFLNLPDEQTDLPVGSINVMSLPVTYLRTTTVVGSPLADR